MKKQSKTKRATSIHVLFFREKNAFIAYSPGLDLSTFGRTFEEAKKNFAETVEIFIEECVNNGTLSDVLKSCGWVKKKNKGWEPPAFIGEGTLDIPSLAVA